MKEQIESLVKTVICGAIAAAAGVAALLFAVVAAFLWVQQRYDTVVASAAAAAIFLLVAVIALVWLFVARRRADARRREEAASTANAAPAWLTDPAMLVAAVQIARTIGIGKLVPLLLTGAAAFGAASLMGSRPAAARPRKTEPKPAKRAA